TLGANVGRPTGRLETRGVGGVASPCVLAQDGRSVKLGCPPVREEGAMRPIRPLVSLIPTAIMLTALVATAPMVAAATIPAQTGAGRPGVSGNARADWYPQFLFHGQNRVNPNETILGANNVSGLTSFWTFPTPPVSAFAAPVVDRGLLFEGEYAGAVQALDATTGQVVWSYQAAAPVVVASAVANGAVFAGDKNGTLYALDEQTGTLLWTGPVSGDQFFDPDNITVVGGIVYAATLTLSASSGTLSAWSASGCGALTCSPLWTANIGAVEAGPAASDARAFVAAAYGGLYAFSTTGCPTPPCAPLWKGLFS